MTRSPIKDVTVFWTQFCTPPGVIKAVSKEASAEACVAGAAVVPPLRDGIRVVPAPDCEPAERRPGRAEVLSTPSVPSLIAPIAGAWTASAGAGAEREPPSRVLRRLPTRPLPVVRPESDGFADSCPADPVVSPAPVSAVATAVPPKIAVPTPRATANAPTRPT
ncbi:MAG: hypothetical protein ACR2JM_09955 [Mycobacterium sp.]